MRLCSYLNCKNRRGDIKMFSFPRHHDARSAIWIQNSGNKDLYSLTPDELKERRICAAHFHPSHVQFRNYSARLLGPAVPIPYDQCQDVDEGSSANNANFQQPAVNDESVDMTVHLSRREDTMLKHVYSGPRANQCGAAIQYHPKREANVPLTASENTKRVYAMELASPNVKLPSKYNQTGKTRAPANQRIFSRKRTSKMFEFASVKSEDPLVIEDVKPVLACRCCLAAERPLQPLEHALASLYEQLTGIPVSQSDIYPKFLCSYCRAMLLKFSAFRENCCSVQAHFLNLHSSGVPITLDSIEDVKGSLYSDLRKSDVKHISVDIPTEIPFKDEPSDDFDTNENLILDSNHTTANYIEIEPMPIDIADGCFDGDPNIGSFNDNPGFNSTDSDTENECIDKQFGIDSDPGIYIDNDLDFDIIDNGPGIDSIDSNLCYSDSNSKVIDIPNCLTEKGKDGTVRKNIQKESTKGTDVGYADILEKVMVNKVKSRVKTSRPFRWIDDDLADSSKEDDNDMDLSQHATDIINVASDNEPHSGDQNNQTGMTTALKQTKNAVVIVHENSIPKLSRKLIKTKKCIYRMINVNNIHKLSPVPFVIQLKSEEKVLQNKLLEQGLRDPVLCLDENIRKAMENKYCVKIVQLSLEDQIKQRVARKDRRSYVDAPYKCELCYTAFNAETAYKNHLAKHSVNQGDHCCAVCSFRFQSKFNLDQHVACHMFDYICIMCGKVNKTREAAIHHHQWHMGVKYNCIMCESSYDGFAPMVDHIKQWHSGKVSCTMCYRTFDDQTGMKKHFTKLHKEAVGAICPTCSVQFHSHDALRRHRPQDGSCDPTHSPCAACGEGFLSDEILNEHKLEYHPRRSFACEVLRCAEQFDSETKLHNHMLKSHIFYGTQEQKPKPSIFICETCGVSVSQRSNLELHMRLHGEKQFQCDQCKKRFISKYKLQRHMSVHMPKTQRRLYPCALCGRQYVKLHNCLWHQIQKHGKAKTYTCVVCEKTFHDATNLQAHVQRKHGDLEFDF